MDTASSTEPSDESRLKDELQREYARRFGAAAEYRESVWRVLTASFFQRFIAPDARVLDLGCGWGQFIHHIQAGKKYGMDLNPDSRVRLRPEVEFLEQDCSQAWPLDENSLDCVFTSNFFEHLPSKDSLRSTLLQAQRCLRPGGRIICLGPNVKYLAGHYWDFWDHYLPLTELSLSEGLELCGFATERCIPRFLPYTMVRQRPVPLPLVRLFLRLPWFWWTIGRQFLVIAKAVK